MKITPPLGPDKLANGLGDAVTVGNGVTASSVAISAAQFCAASLAVPAIRINQANCQHETSDSSASS